MMVPEVIEAALLRAERMTGVMSRVPVNIDEALRPENGAAMIAATRVCGRCTSAGACDAWIVAHDEGDGHEIPDFCPNAELMRSFRPRSG